MVKILVVDDSDALRTQLCSDLKKGGYETMQAVDGVDGLEKLKADATINMIFVDINMPNMDGLTLCELLRKLDAHKATPIFLITTETNEEMKKKAKELGVKAWIRKPHDPVKLLEAVKKITGK